MYPYIYYFHEINYRNKFSYTQKINAVAMNAENCTAVHKKSTQGDHSVIHPPVMDKYLFTQQNTNAPKVHSIHIEPMAHFIDPENRTHRSVCEARLPGQFPANYNSKKSLTIRHSSQCTVETIQLSTINKINC